MASKMKFVFIGAGNVATQMALKLKKEKQSSLQVYSRKIKNAKSLAAILKCPYTSSLKKINKDADVYIIAVSDDAIGSIAEKLKLLNQKGKTFIHTSGSVSSSILSKQYKSSGVIWPAQSLSKESKIDFAKIPLCITTESHNLNQIKKIAKLLSKKIYVLSDEEKKTLHLAAVFANNFTNHMIHLSKRICEENDLNFDILKPLISETFIKADKVGPEEAQTGPAIRKDIKVINAQLDLLKGKSEIKSIYRLISKNIKSINNEDRR